MFSKVDSKHAFSLYKLQSKQFLLSLFIASQMRKNLKIKEEVLWEVVKTLRELSGIFVDVLNAGKFSSFNSKLAYSEAREEVRVITGEYIEEEDKR